ncbi:DUF5789 family protein [Halovivax cerinus]|uniref:DUF2795 domain-containing protein n=1 Tax=Halovivax cerinus TaxID=1487865 RepID=A0ABD5NPW2_9EURY|nr:DUF2795 domain-containing protein [Halovivax cerinus]
MHAPGSVTIADDLEYPLTTDELIATHGDRRIDLPNGSETVGEVLGRISAETFESPDDVRLTLQSGLSRKAIGRYGYSDRDPDPPGSLYHSTQLSF